MQLYLRILHILIFNRQLIDSVNLSMKCPTKLDHSNSEGDWGHLLKTEGLSTGGLSPEWYKGKWRRKDSCYFFAGAPVFTFNLEVTFDFLALTHKLFHYKPFVSWYKLTQDTEVSSRPLTGFFGTPVYKQTFYILPYLNVQANLANFYIFICWPLHLFL